MTSWETWRVAANSAEEAEENYYTGEFVGEELDFTDVTVTAIKDAA